MKLADWWFSRSRGAGGHPAAVPGFRLTCYRRFPSTGAASGSRFLPINWNRCFFLGRPVATNLLEGMFSGWFRERTGKYLKGLWRAPATRWVQKFAGKRIFDFVFTPFANVGRKVLVQQAYGLGCVYSCSRCFSKRASLPSMSFAAYCVDFCEQFPFLLTVLWRRLVTPGLRVARGVV